MSEEQEPTVDNHWRLSVHTMADRGGALLSTEVTGDTDVEESDVPGVLRLSYIDYSTGRRSLVFVAVRNLEAIELEHLG
jgi:hypothetical protein